MSTASPDGQASGIVAGDSGSEPPEGLDRAAWRTAQRARDAAEASRDRFAFLAEVSRCLADSLDYETTLTTVASMSLPYFGAWCMVDICSEDGEIRRVAVVHPNPAKQTIARQLRQNYPPSSEDLVGTARVIRSGRPEMAFEIPDSALVATARDPEQLRLLRELGVESYVTVPMVARGRVVGAMTFVTAESGRRFGDVDLIIAEDLARRAAMAVDNARLYRDAEAARTSAEEAAAEAEAAAEEAEIAMDEAERSRAAAEAANRAKSDFLAAMSHELRTPLNAIAGYAELIELGVRGPVTQEQRADIARIQKSQRHLIGLINSVLNFARLEAGAVHFSRQEVSLTEALSVCETLIRPQLLARGLEFEFEGCDPEIRVRTDPEKLQQIVLNLLTNAVKFTDPGGRITLACKCTGGTAMVTVTDTGDGIAAEDLARVFEPFVQVDAALTRTHDGVGLGLAISRDLARALGGELTAESELGMGSTFTLTLPRT